MNCDPVLLHAYVDGELDLVRSLEIERHIDACKTCAQFVENQQALSAAVRDGGLYHRPPRELKPRVDAALRRTARATEVRPSHMRWPLIALAACLLLAVFFAARVLSPGLPAGAGDLMAREVLDSHLRSLMPGHLSDVQSSDRHTVKPWFNGKLDFSPPVVDLLAQGFPLIGGRLDSLAGRTVAVLIYQRRQHTINVYVWPAAGSSDTRTVSTTRQGYNIAHLVRAGMNWWIASDLNQAELNEFAGLLRPEGP